MRASPLYNTSLSTSSGRSKRRNSDPRHGCSPSFHQDMVEIPKQGEMGSLHQDQQEDGRRGPDSRTQRPDGSLLLDMERLSLLVDGGVNGNAAVETSAGASRVPMFLQKTQSRKFSQKGDRKAAADGDALLPTTTSGNGGGRGGAAPPCSAAAAAATLAAGAPDKFVTVALAPPASAEAIATASPRQPAPCRRAHGRRAIAPSPWLDPRRVLIFFATLSSMGTIILLYFMLSMGKMGDGDANAR